MAGISVPYSGVPEVTPQGGGTPYGHVETNPAAFGITEGEAISHSGDVLAQHAQRFQELNLETQSREALLGAMTDSASLRANFHNLQGNQANEQALTKYYTDLGDIRTQYRGNLPPMAQKMFDDSFMRYMGYEINAGATHVAQQTKVWRTQTADATIKMAQSEAAANSGDDLAFKNQLTNIDQGVGVKQRELGWDDNETKMHRQQELSEAWSRRLISMAKTQPFRAQKLYQDNKGEFFGNDIYHVGDAIQSQLHLVGARNISDAVNTGRDPANAESPSESRLPSSFLDRIKDIEGFDAKPRWDVKQWTVGFGTKATSPNERPDRPELERRFETEITKAANTVDGVNDHLDPGTRAALASLTFNTGDAWTKGGLGDAIRKGDLPLAKQLFLQYNEVDGKYNQAIADRRAKEAQWFGASEASAGSLKDRIDKGVAYAKTVAPDDALFQDAVRTRITADYHNQQQQILDVERQNRNTVEDSLYGQGDKKPPTTIEQLFAGGPKVQEAYEALEPKQRHAIQVQLARNAKGETQMTEDGYRRLDSLRGMAVNQPEEFSNLKIWDEEQLNAKSKLELSKLQRTVKSKAEDVHLRQALTDLKDLMDEQDITAKDPERHNQFVGSLQRVMQDEQTRLGRPLKYDEVIQLGTRLMRQTARDEPPDPYKGVPFMERGESSPQTLFEQEVPSEMMEGLKKRYQDSGMPVPSDAEINREYVRQRYQQLYGPKASFPPAQGLE